jgi:predicted outer membrane repeat protein
MDADPLFCDWVTEEYSLAGNSPCLTGGTGGSRIGRYPAGCSAITPRTRTVPLQYASIQDAILHAYQGDTVLVSAGAYFENIIFWGRRVLLTSQFTLSGDTSQIGQTVLNGGGPATNKSVMSFVGAEDSMGVLRGFTITNGYASGDHAGGVTIANGSRPKILDCRIVGNTGSSNSVSGIGILCAGSSPTISRCLISNNSAPVNGNYDHQGGGMYIGASSTPLVTDCSIIGNIIAASVWYRNFGGGVYCNGSSPVFRNCTIAGNIADYGGGICALGASNVVARNCLFHADSVRSNGGAVASYVSSVIQLDSCSVTRSYAAGNGGALYMEQSGKVNATRSTITDNSASMGAGVFAASGSTPTLTNCIVWYNWFNEISPLTLTQISYCDIRGGYQGTGNVDVDPLFCDWLAEQYTLAGNSSCLTAGSGGSRMGYYPTGCSSIMPRTRNVPLQYATIQDAILHAYQGDTVLVSTGTRTENTNFWGRRVLLTSQFTLSGDTSHIGLTVLNGGGSLANKSVVSIVEAEDSMSVLRGFTITNGYASGSHGGGVTIANGSRPRIEDCRIVGNTGTSGTMSGIGISCTGSAPRISRCVIQNNTAPVNGNYDHLGGGVYIASSSSPLFVSCSINQNAIAASVYYRNCGGGVYCSSSTPVFHNCFISENTADQGGGIYLSGSSTAQIVNCLVLQNQVRTLGGGLYSTSSTPTSVNNTFSMNVAASGGGAIYSVNSTNTIANTICWRDTTTSHQEIGVSGGSTTITYSDIQGGWTGTGNIDANPLFETGTSFRLWSNSPCVDAGNPDPAYNDPADPARPDSALFPARGGLRSDMGAYGGSGAVGPTKVGDRNTLGEPPLTFRLEQNYPNPFNSATTLVYQLPLVSDVRLVVYDLLGREVAVLVNEKKAPGTYEARFNAGRLATGVYFYRLIAGTFVETIRMMLIR